MATTKPQFGVNPFDRCPNERARYHVVDDLGFIRCKNKFGYIAESNAWDYSEKESDTTFTVIDTQDGSVHSTFRNGADIQ